MEIKDLKIGQEIIYFDRYGEHTSKITLIDCSNNYDHFFKVEESDEHFNKHNYKRTDTYFWYSTTWCFADNTKYVKHLERLVEHENNKKERKKVYRETQKCNIENLEKIREFVLKAMEQGYIWYCDYRSQSGGRTWFKGENPKFYFKNHYYYFDVVVSERLGTHEVRRIKGQHKNIALEKPEENK